MILIVNKLLGHFMKMNCKRLSKKNSELKKHLREKVINYMLNGKVNDNSFNSWIDKIDF